MEKVLRKNSAGEMIEWNNFTPVNLKWSGIRNSINKTIQPGRKVYCDIGNIPHPNYYYESIDLKREDGSIYQTVYLIKDNQDFLKDHPKKERPRMKITDILGEVIEI